MFFNASGHFNESLELKISPFGNWIRAHVSSSLLYWMDCFGWIVNWCYLCKRTDWTIDRVSYFPRSLHMTCFRFIFLTECLTRYDFKSLNDFLIWRICFCLHRCRTRIRDRVFHWCAHKHISNSIRYIYIKKNYDEKMIFKLNCTHKTKRIKLGCWIFFWNRTTTRQNSAVVTSIECNFSLFFLNGHVLLIGLKLIYTSLLFRIHWVDLSQTKVKLISSTLNFFSHKQLSLAAYFPVLFLRRLLLV